MIFSIDRTAMLNTVNHLQRVVGAKTSMPVLDGIYLSAKKGSLTLIAYNLEMGMRKEIYANCEEEGEVVINARLLADILRKMNGLQVEISCDEKLNCHIKSGEATFDIIGMAAIDFPKMPSIDNSSKFSIDAKLFLSMIKGTIFSAAQNEDVTTPILKGINVDIKNGVMQFVAVDGFRLAIRRENVNINEDFSFIVTNKALGEISKLIEEDTDKIEIKVNKNLISFYVNGYIFISRLLEGSFINFERTIPAEHKQRVIMNVRELIDTVERVSLLISDSFSTPVRCYFNEHSVVLTTITSMGRAKETLFVELEGENFEIGINSRYILDALKATEREKIEILFNGPNAGIVINEIDGDSFKYVIMPQRLK